MRTELEEVIDYLKVEKGISLTEMYEKVNMSRDEFYNTRRTAKDVRKAALLNKLKEIYKTELLTYKKPDSNKQESDNAIQEKYIKLLETQNELLAEQQALLKRERDLLEADLSDKIKKLQEKLNEVKK